MTTEKKIGDKYFALDLRRTLYFAQMMNMQCEWTKEFSNHRELKITLNNVINANKRLLLVVSSIAKNPETYAAIKQDLTDEYAKDLALLIDELFEVADLSGIIKAVQTVKEQWKAEQQQAA